MKLFEAFEALEALNEETFAVSDDGVKKLDTFMQDNEDSDDIVDVIDPEAETEEDIQDSYVGKVILDCSVCHSKIYKDKTEVTIDEEQQLANVGEDCPYCYTSDGFKVIGEVAPFADKDEDIDDVEEEEVVEESLTEAVGTLEKPMSAFAGTLSNVMTAHQGELASIGSKAEALAFLDSIEPEVKNKGYLATVKEKVTKLPDFKVLTFLYNIILKGDGMGSKLESLVESHRGDRHRVTAELFDILSENGFDTDAEDVEDYVFAARDLVFEEVLADPSKSIRETVEQWYKDTNVNYPEDLDSLTRLDEGIIDTVKKTVQNIKNRPKYKEVLGHDLKTGMIIKFDSGHSGEILDIEKVKAPRGDKFLMDVKIKYDDGRVKTGKLNADAEWNVLQNPKTQESLDEGIFDTVKQKVKDFKNRPKYKEIPGHDLKTGMTIKFDSGYTGEIVDIEKVKARGDDEYWLKLNIKDADGKVKTTQINPKADWNVLQNPKTQESLDEGIFDVFKKKGKKSDTKSSNSFASATAGGLRKGDKVRIDDYRIEPHDRNETLLILRTNPMPNSLSDIFIEYRNTSGRVDNVVLPNNLKVKVLLTDNNESLKEDINNLSLDTDDTHMEMTSDENGKVTVTTEPIKKTNTSDEVIVPVSDETRTQIENNNLETEEDVDFEEFDETSFDELGESYLKESFDNVVAFRTNNVTMSGDNLIVEGLIKFDSGNVKKTSFTFTAKDFLKEGIYRFVGKNNQLVESNSFELVGKIKDTKFICESLTEIK